LDSGFSTTGGLVRNRSLRRFGRRQWRVRVYEVTALLFACDSSYCSELGRSEAGQRKFLFKPSDLPGWLRDFSLATARFVSLGPARPNPIQSDLELGQHPARPAACGRSARGCRGQPAAPADRPV